MRPALIAVALLVCGALLAAGFLTEGTSERSAPMDTPAMTDADPAASDMSTGPLDTGPTEKFTRTEAEWRALLTPEQYRITREAGTERAFTGEYWDTKTAGTYACRCCGVDLFASDAKFDSGCGWPSFFEPLENFQITELEDLTYGMRRVEVRCRKCDAHLGHVFPDGPEPTGQRYCINSASIKLQAADAANDGGEEEQK